MSSKQMGQRSKTTSEPEPMHVLDALIRPRWDKRTDGENATL